MKLSRDLLSLLNSTRGMSKTVSPDLCFVFIITGPNFYYTYFFKLRNVFKVLKKIFKIHIIFQHSAKISNFTITRHASAENTKSKSKKKEN